MTSGEYRHLNVAQIVWQAVQRCGGWASTDAVGDEVRKVIPYYPNKCAADVLRNLKQRDLVLHKPAIPGTHTAGQRGCSRWKVDPDMREPEWRLAGGRRAKKNHGTRLRESDKPKPGKGKIALEECWPENIRIPPAIAPARVHYGLMADD